MNQKPWGYWNEETCREEAKKYSSRGEFSEKACSAWSVAKRNGWIDTYDWFKEPMKRNYYTKEKCFELAKQCSSITEFSDKFHTAYVVSLRKGYISEYFWLGRVHQNQYYYTEEKCREIASVYKTKVEFKKNNPSAYGKARRNGWLKTYDWFVEIQKPNGYWNRERCYEAATKCSCASEMVKNFKVAYGIARKNGWDSEYVWFTTPAVQKLNNEEKKHEIYVYEDFVSKVCYVGLSKNVKQRDKGHRRLIKGKADSVKKYFDSIGMNIPKPKILESGLTPEEAQVKEDFWKIEYAKNGWTLLNKAKTGKGTSSLGGFAKWDFEAVKKEAGKFTTLMDFANAKGSAYNVALANGWLDNFAWLLRADRVKWNYDACKEEAMKYCSRKEFKSNNLVAYRICFKNKWIDDFYWLPEVKKGNGHWNENTCREEAKKYKTLKEFRLQSGSAYNVSRNLGILNSFDWLYIDAHNTPKRVVQLTFEGNVVGIYNTVHEAGVTTGITHISDCCMGKRKQSGGFIWKYAE